MDDLKDYSATSEALVAVFTIEVQTLPEDMDRILDEVMKVHRQSQALGGTMVKGCQIVLIDDLWRLKRRMFCAVSISCISAPVR